MCDILHLAFSLLAGIFLSVIYLSLPRNHLTAHIEKEYRKIDSEIAANISVPHIEHESWAKIANIGENRSKTTDWDYPIAGVVYNTIFRKQKERVILRRSLQISVICFVVIVIMYQLDFCVSKQSRIGFLIFFIALMSVIIPSFMSVLARFCFTHAIRSMENHRDELISKAVRELRNLGVQRAEQNNEALLPEKQQAIVEGVQTALEKANTITGIFKTKR